MSVRTALGRPDGEPVVTDRALGLLSGAAVTLAYLGVLYRIVTVTGSVAAFLAVVVGALATAVLLSSVLSDRAATGLGAALLLVGLSGYLAIVPQARFDLVGLLGETVALLTGRSVLRIAEAWIWAIGFTPGPLFVSWYFFLRGRYVGGAAVGGAAAGFFVLTGDAGTLVGLVGVLGVVGALGFGQLERYGGTRAQRGILVAIIAIMVVVATTVSVVPGGNAQPLASDGVGVGPGSGEATLEAGLVNAGTRLPILGSINLSPTVRFVVRADRPSAWRVGAYDRYTGEGWVRTGSTTAYDGALARPPGNATAINQTYALESELSVLPAAWKPVRVEGVDARVTRGGSPQPAGSLPAGKRYTVRSYAPDWTPRELRNASTEYPDAIEDRYLQLPASTPDRLGGFTAKLTDGAESPYETAVIVERWLRQNKNYSLDVERPDGNIAASFLFEMEAGYCTYFATTMVVMLRSQGIPARLAVGYTSGQSIGNDTWVVRGLDSHAWVEVYFPGTGWVRFDPTPAAPRQDAESTRLREARARNVSNVDVPGSTPTPTPTPEITGPAPEQGEAIGGTATRIGTRTVETPTRLAEEANIPAGAPFTTAPGTDNRTAAAGADGGSGLPSRRTVILGAILAAGLVAAGRRSGLFERGYRSYWLRQPPDGDPDERIDGTIARLEYLLSRRYRPRVNDETWRDYLADLRSRGVDDRALRIYRIYERARYADDVDPDAADTATRLLDELVRDGTATERRG